MHWECKYYMETFKSLGAGYILLTDNGSTCARCGYVYKWNINQNKSHKYFKKMTYRIYHLVNNFEFL